jgi:uncharacterized protein YydD (DUF2326 family)
MIHEVWSERPSFKRLKFRRGLNIVLAARSAGGHDAASDDQGRTRNGAGSQAWLTFCASCWEATFRRERPLSPHPFTSDVAPLI